MKKRTTILWAKDTAANWSIKNPILTEGEHGLESDTRKYKIGDGVHHYRDLPYHHPQIVQEFGDSKITTVSQKVISERLEELKKIANIFKRQEKFI